MQVGQSPERQTEICDLFLQGAMQKQKTVEAPTQGNAGEKNPLKK